MRFYSIIMILMLSLTAVSLSSSFSDGVEYLFPQPGSEHVSRFSDIIVRFDADNTANLDNISDCIQLTGTISGKIAGHTSIASRAPRHGGGNRIA